MLDADVRYADYSDDEPVCLNCDDSDPDCEYCEEDSPASRALLEATNDPDNFDFGFEAERSDSGFANFDFNPGEAAQLRSQELQRMSEAQTPVLKMGTELLVSGHKMFVVEINRNGIVAKNGERRVPLTHEQAARGLELLDRERHDARLVEQPETD